MIVYLNILNLQTKKIDEFTFNIFYYFLNLSNMLFILVEDVFLVYGK
mgnify:CR=1 FL=1